MDHKRTHGELPGYYVEVALDRISGKWKGLILYALMTRGPLRFNDLRRCLPKITHRVLTLQLRDMEDAGLIGRDVQMTTQMRVTYALTKYGEALHPVIIALEAWGACGTDPTVPSHGHVDPAAELQDGPLREGSPSRQTMRSVRSRSASEAVEAIASS
ncbi:winged helix-turn-helix transcriptional regulator [Nguyenibacter vanlangensis]|uniref:Helix-turn-helix transcriptional regulator n=1 Tax=Nguyenibacter vanlangensis TaxID=1216886 RepID=A0A7Y7IU36_9PROT|nr:helix-turn-helix domain-containing protein [Nguyenibacter vanlangensis]NVN10310.1 helix-turn-helix transcriptional regulator [Nguyenibacter vanlangensis]